MFNGSLLKFSLVLRVAFPLRCLLLDDLQFISICTFEINRACMVNLMTSRFGICTLRFSRLCSYKIFWLPTQNRFTYYVNTQIFANETQSVYKILYDSLSRLNVKCHQVLCPQKAFKCRSHIK